MRVTERELKNKYYYIIPIGYCVVERLCNRLTRHYYTAGVHGWRSDCYVLTDILRGFNVLLSTGYNPVHNRQAEKEQGAFICDFKKRLLEIERKISPSSEYWEIKKVHNAIRRAFKESKKLIDHK